MNNVFLFCQGLIKVCLCNEYFRKINKNILAKRNHTFLFFQRHLLRFLSNTFQKQALLP